MVDSTSLIFCDIDAVWEEFVLRWVKVDGFEAVAGERKETCEKKMTRGRERMAKGRF